ncbi:MAG TPA: hypothetical protein VKA31_01855 [Mariprofundaceae bacterium]|nr:hypothetical protein [Mariprofundaceae bacterium]
MIKYSEHKPVSADARMLQRRGWQLGWIMQEDRPALPEATMVAEAWNDDAAVMLPGVIPLASLQADIDRARDLMEQALSGAELADIFEDADHLENMRTFPLVGVSSEDHDDQGLEKIYFDAEQDDELLAEGLWCKASWLSFCDDDASVRFRFSFGMEGFEDVAADPVSQHWAGELCQAVFPESRAITENSLILDHLRHLLGGEPAFVERIVYFNAPNGGAQMHHDVERGHDGVVFAQLSGATFWLALSKPRLIDELTAFVSDPAHAAAVAVVMPEVEDREKLAALIADRAALSEYMEEPDHELLEAIMDRSPDFIGHLVGRGYAHVLEAGDVLLMPQRDLDNCVWHCVFCLGDEAGEGLSFAVRPA